MFVLQAIKNFFLILVPLDENRNDLFTSSDSD